MTRQQTKQKYIDSLYFFDSSRIEEYKETLSGRFEHYVSIEDSIGFAQFVFDEELQALQKVFRDIQEKYPKHKLLIKNDTSNDTIVFDLYIQQEYSELDQQLANIQEERTKLRKNIDENKTTLQQLDTQYLELIKQINNEKI